MLLKSPLIALGAAVLIAVLAAVSAHPASYGDYYAAPISRTPMAPIPVVTPTAPTGRRRAMAIPATATGGRRRPTPSRTGDGAGTRDTGLAGIMGMTGIRTSETIAAVVTTIIMTTSVTTPTTTATSGGMGWKKDASLSKDELTRRRRHYCA